MATTEKQAAIRKAQLESERSRARLHGRKIRASIEGPRAAVGGFPYCARTCAEWEELNGKFIDRDPTDEERDTDALEGSARLRDAILRMAA